MYYRKILLSIIIIGSLIFGSSLTGQAVDISNYTAFPPFLPRVVSPNVLFVLDYSKSMVRPSYGTCYTYGSNAVTPASYANCGSVLTGDRVFNHMTDDYSSTTAYYGYFDNGYGRTDTGYSHCASSNTYNDTCAFKYTCSANGTCSKDSGGSWNGNWLNWLAMTQFDVMKKVVVGGDTTPAPDNQNAGSPNLESKLTSLDDTGTSLVGGIYKAVTDAGCSGRAPNCSTTTPQTLPYSWIDSAESGVTGITTVFGAPTDSTTVLGSEYSISKGNFRTATPPFDTKIYGYDFPAASTQLRIRTNGWFIITNTATGKYVWFRPYFTDTAGYYLDVEISKNSTVKTFTKGSAPNRIFVISYENMISQADVGRAQPLSFQVFISEGSQIAFQYKEVWTTYPFGGGKNAQVSIYYGPDYAGTVKLYSNFPASSTLSNSQAIFMTPGAVLYQVTPVAISPTIFQLAAPLAVTSGAGRNDYNVNIQVSSKAKPAEGCKDGWYSNNTQNNKTLCYDHEIVGLFQDLADGELAGTLAFRLGVMRVGYNDNDGGDIKTKGKEINASTTASFFTATRGDGPTDRTSLGEALYEAMRFFKQDSPYWPSSGTADYNYDDATDLGTCSNTGNEYDPYCFQSAAQKVECCKSFILLLSSGNYSDDFGLNIYDAISTGETPNAPQAMGGSIPGCKSTLDNSATCTGGDEGLKANGGWLDDVAYRARVTDLRTDLNGTQNINLYVVNTFGAGSGDGTAILRRAAKYGGFEDVDADNAYDTDKYNLVSGQCTRVDSGGAFGEEDKNCDGNPDTYFEASGGGDLKSKIIAAVADILRTSASGTSVSVLSTSASGEGGIYQAYFYPAKTENQTEQRTWPGYIRAFFLDTYQNLRDDFSSSGAPDAKLIMANDRIVQMSLNTTTNAVDINLFTDADGKPPFTAAGSTNLDGIVSIWEGGKKLATMTKTNRTIATWVPDTGAPFSSASNTTPAFDSLSGTPMAFTDSNKIILKPFLRATDDAEAGNIINFIRGNAISGYRNRCISITDGGGDETGCTDTDTATSQRVWALGDIVYSTPTLVSGPGEKYDEIYSDSGYRSFKSAYKGRRSMVWVGANDGMLHGFNAGVYTSGDNCAGAATADVESGCFAANPGSSGWGSPALGDELFAFVPYDNLPHLSWLACNGTSTAPSVCSSAEYTHVYYVDQRPKATDVRIFNDSATSTSGLINGQDTSHPFGWGTILIVGMRLGGGAMDVTAAFDGSTTTTKQFRSTYYTFDITDPEKPPKLLWRFTDTNLNFTTSYPGIVKICSNDTIPCTGTEKWFMIVGSGPDNYVPGSGSRGYGGTSTRQGRIYVVDLTTGTSAMTFTNLGVNNSSGTAIDSNAFMGDPTVVDADLSDFTADTIYIGDAYSTSPGTPDTWTLGKVYRINTKGDTSPTAWELSILINQGKAMLISPSVAKDSKNNLWVFFGTGRLRSTGDLSNSDQQTFYGIKDGCWKGTGETTCFDVSSSPSFAYDTNDLVNTTAVTVTTTTGGATQVSEGTGTEGCEGLTSSSATECSYSTLRDTVRNKHGWFVNLNLATPSERVLSRSVVLGGLVLFTSYTPVSDICSVFGDSALYSLYYETGTAYSKSTVGTYASGGTEYISKSTSLGLGMPTAVGVAIGEKVVGYVQKSTGEIVRVEAEPGLGVRSGAAGWREKTRGGGTIELEELYKHIVK